MLSSPLHKSPSAIACIPFIVGILVASYLDINSTTIIYCCVAICTLLIILQFTKTRQRSLSNFLQLILLITLFILLGYARYRQVNLTNEYTGNIKSSYIATIQTIPAEKAKSYRLDVSIDSAIIGDTTYAVHTKAIAYFEKDSTVLELLPGERIRFKSTLNPPTGVMNPEDFNYKDFLIRKRIFATSYISSKDWHRVDGVKLSLRSISARAQNYVVNILKAQNYDQEELALVSALTVGYKQIIGQDQRQAYVASGATHVLAVSGLHVGIIFIFLTWIFKITGLNKRKILWIRVIFIILLLWCFAFITGLSPSVTRATVMFTLVSIGTATKQRNCIFNTVFLSAFFLLVYNPYLVFDIGFQLSYTAVLGIISFQPYITPFLINKLRIPKFFADLIGVSLAAQIGTLPITLHTFNCFPTYFLITNIWIIPLVSLIVNGAIILILTALAGAPTIWIAFPLEWLLKTMNFGVKVISHLPHALCTNLYIDSVTVLLIYLLYILILFALDTHSKRYLYASITVIFVALFFNYQTMEEDKKHKQLFVFNDRSAFAISAQQGLHSCILLENDSTNNTTMPAYFIHHYMAKKMLDVSSMTNQYHKGEFRLDRNFVITSNHIHAIYSPELDKHSKPLHINALIINTDEPQNIYKLYEYLKFNTLVIYQRPKMHINYYRNFCNKNGIKLHKVYEDGAYQIDL